VKRLLIGKLSWKTRTFCRKLTN